MTACAGKVQYRTVVAVPPAALMQDCPERPVAIILNRDLVEKIESLRGDLDRCNADKAALREWAEKAVR